MFGPKISIKAGGSGSGPVLSSLQKLDKRRVYVGIPEQKIQRRKVKGKQQPINNAQLLFIFSNGSPAHHQPPRPVVEPAINAPDNKESITGELKLAASAALDGKDTASKQFMRRAGMDAMNRVKKWFLDPRNAWAPNAPSTLRRKEAKARKAMKGAEGPLIVVPGIDTAQMRNAITYVMGDE